MTDTVPVTQALKPCPFCGSPAELGVVTEGGEANPDFGGHYAQCTNERCHGCMGLRFACGDDPRPELVVAWNTRAGEQSRASTPAVDREAIARQLYEWSPVLHDARTAASPLGTFAYARWGEVSDDVRAVFRERAAILALHPPVMGEVEAENARLTALARANNDLARREAAGRRELQAENARLRDDLEYLTGVPSSPGVMNDWRAPEVDAAILRCEEHGDRETAHVLRQMRLAYRNLDNEARDLRATLSTDQVSRDG